jgi:hypothetical protein
MNAVDEEVEQTEFDFDELSDKAKEHARDKFREHHLDYNWWEYVYDEAATTAKLFGMEIGMRAEAHGNRHVTRMVGVVDIRFNGFYTQGSGACWSGTIYTDQLAGAVERVEQFAPNDDTLMQLARMAEELHALIASQHAINRLSSNGDLDFPDVEMGMRLTVNGNERNWGTSIDGSDVPNNIERVADKLVDSFGDWIHGQLEDEYGYQMDDEQIDAAIEFAGLAFDEDGNAL